MVLDSTLNGETMRFWLTFFIGCVFAHFLSIWHEEDNIQQLKAWSFRMWKNLVHTQSNSDRIARWSSITFFLCILYYLEVDSNGRRPWYQVWMVGGGGSGGIVSQKMFEIWSSEMPFPAFWASKFALKFMLTILVFEIKEENKRTKSKKILTIIFHYLLEGDSNSWRPRVWGHTPAENFWNLKPGNAIFCILSIANLL
jgi:hypothetical protein